LRSRRRRCSRVLLRAARRQGRRSFNVEFATQRCNVDVDLLVVVRFILSWTEVLRENLRLSDVGFTKNRTELSVSTVVGRSDC